jgi:hypothetical protein
MLSDHQLAALAIAAGPLVISAVFLSVETFRVVRQMMAQRVFKGRGR